MLLLVVSDAFIPDRAVDLPIKFKKLLSVPDKISQVIVLGNSTKSSSFLKFINQISTNVTHVRGEFDNGRLPISERKHKQTTQYQAAQVDPIITNERLNEEIPLNAVIKQGEFKIGCCSGYTIVPKNDPLALFGLARQLNVDIMLWGGTHNVEAYTLENKFFVNPGSCTGAFNTDWPVLGDDESKEEDATVSKSQKSQEHEHSEKDGKKGEEDPIIHDDTGIANSNRKEEGNSNDNNDKNSKEKEKGEIPGEGEQEEKEDAATIKSSNKEDGISKDPENKGEEEEGTDKDKDKDNIPFDEDDVDISDLDINGSNVPSFCLLDIQGSTCKLYIYLYVDGEVKVDKVIYEKRE